MSDDNGSRIDFDDDHSIYVTEDPAAVLNRIHGITTPNVPIIELNDAREAAPILVNASTIRVVRPAQPPTGSASF